MCRYRTTPPANRVAYALDSAVSASASTSGSAQPVSRANQRSRETADLFGGVEDRAGVNTRAEDYSMF